MYTEPLIDPPVYTTASYLHIASWIILIQQKGSSEFWIFQCHSENAMAIVFTFAKRDVQSSIAYCETQICIASNE